MNNNDYVEILNFARQRANDIGLPTLDPSTIMESDDERFADPRLALLRYLTAMSDIAALRSTNLEERILDNINSALTTDSQKVEGLDLIHNEPLSTSFGLERVERLRGSSEISEIRQRIERLKTAIAEQEGGTIWE